MTAPDLPESYFLTDVCAALHVSRKRVEQLMRDGRVGFLTTRPRTMLPEHISQLRECIEVTPAARQLDDFAIPGRTARSRRRRTA